MAFSTFFLTSVNLSANVVLNPRNSYDKLHDTQKFAREGSQMMQLVAPERKGGSNMDLEAQKWIYDDEMNDMSNNFNEESTLLSAKYERHP